MAQNFIGCDRGQVLLLPPSLSDWLPEDHLAWTVLGAVDQMDLAAFYGAYRANGQGRAAYDPAMMVALLLYAYCVGNRSSRGIEKACRVDVAYKVICAMQIPDHSTIAEFRRRHATALGELFVAVLALCREAGLVSVGVVAIDGTKMRASASRDRNRSYESIVTEILQEAERVDREEDERHGDARGDELPEHMRTREGRRAALKAAREKLEAERRAQQEAGESIVQEVELELDPERFVTRPEGRRAWLREGHRALDAQRERDARAIPRSREARVAEVKRRFDEELAFEHAANRCYETHRAGGRMRNGRRFGAPPKPVQLAVVPEGKINTTDPDSSLMHTQGRFGVQGYNAQAAITDIQIIIAAELTTDSPDFGHLEPTVRAMLRDLQQAGITQTPGTVLADAGYWHKQQIENIVSDGMQVLVPPDSSLNAQTRTGWDGGMYAFMRRVLTSPHGRELYQNRRRIEPVFGQIKHNRKADRFQRRGRAAARAEWRLIAATHNLLKLHTHWTQPAIA
jgi:transposase